MTLRPSRQHYRVQTHEPGGWITRAHTVVFGGAILAAEDYADARGLEARVLLGRVEYYRTSSTAPATEHQQEA
jgi:hypothetical protein